MNSKKIKYLLEERGCFYYQRRVPKSLAYHLGIARWHKPVGQDYTVAIERVSQMRREHDALIIQARENPETLTQLRRKREVVEQDREAASIKLEAEYRTKVISGKIDDAATLADIETENLMDIECPNWKSIGDFLEELKRSRIPRSVITVLAANTDRYFTDNDLNKVVEPFINIIEPSQIDEWRSTFIGVKNIRLKLEIDRPIDDDEYFDRLRDIYDGHFGLSSTPPTDEDERIEWDILKMKLERLMARFAPDPDRLSAVFENFLAFNTIKTEPKYRRVFAQFIDVVQDIPITQVTPKLLRSYRDHLLGRNLEIASVKAAFTPIKSLFVYALNEEIIDANPAHSVTFPRDNRPIEEKRHLPFTPSEMVNILTTVDNLWGETFQYLSCERRIAIRHIVRALAFTAARPVELMSLRAEDVTDFSINIRRTKTKSSWRYIPVHPEINDFPTFIRSGGLDCLQTNKTDIVEPVRHNFMRLIRVHMDPAIMERRKTLYSFRGTFQDALRRAGAPMEIRQAILGHREGGAIKHYNSGPEFGLMVDWVQKADPRK